MKLMGKLTDEQCFVYHKYFGTYARYANPS